MAESSPWEPPVEGADGRTSWRSLLGRAVGGVLGWVPALVLILSGVGLLLFGAPWMDTASPAWAITNLLGGACLAAGLAAPWVLRMETRSWGP